ncbi:MAG: ATP/GTP-binding protein [Candidatus Hadarchaeum sp.]
MRSLNLIILGTAGAGKTALTQTFGRWLEENTEQKVAYINLDPGCDSLPFQPNFDIRNHFTIERIMQNERLGPNGAMVRASELLEEKANEFSKLINKTNADIRMIDTPGQMEVFLFHGGREITALLDGKTLSLFLFDARIAARAMGLVFTTLLGLTIGLRLETPTINIINKIDLLQDPAVIDKIAGDSETMEKQILEETSGLTTDLVLKLSRTLPELLPASRLVKVSAKTGYGMRELHDILYEVFCTCGDLT